MRKGKRPFNAVRAAELLKAAEAVLAADGDIYYDSSFDGNEKSSTTMGVEKMRKALDWLAFVVQSNRRGQ